MVADHFTEAERLLALAEQLANADTFSGDRDACTAALAARAQAHATLALVQATVELQRI